MSQPKQLQLPTRLPPESLVGRLRSKAENVKERVPDRSQRRPLSGPPPSDWIPGCTCDSCRAYTLQNPGPWYDDNDGDDAEDTDD